MTRNKSDTMEMDSGTERYSLPFPPNEKEPLRSTKNTYIRKLRHFLSASGFRRSDAIPIEGRKLLLEALQTGLILDTVLLTPRFEKDPINRPLMNSLRKQCRQVLQAEENVLQYLSDTEQNQGVFAFFRKPERELPASHSDLSPLVLILADLQDPGNCGTLIRSLLAFGGKQLVTIGMTADPFSPKVLRSSAGAALHVRSVHFADFRRFRDHPVFRDLPLVATVVRGGVYPESLSVTLPFGLIIGNESRGLSADIIRSCDQRISLPMEKVSESLNAAVAGSLLMYELSRACALGPFRADQ